MNLEDQVCSLELAKRLKELRVKQESLYSWQTCHDCNDTCGSVEWELTDSLTFPRNHPRSEVYSAFTASELSALLPNYVITREEEPFNCYRIFIEKFISVEDDKQINNWIINYHSDTTVIDENRNFFVNKLTKNIYAPTLANAMAKMLIYLVENKLLKLHGEDYLK